MKNFLVYAPELQLMDVDPGNPLDEDGLHRWASRYFHESELGRFIAEAKPGDFLTTKDITVMRLGKDFTE